MTFPVGVTSSTSITAPRSFEYLIVDGGGDDGGAYYATGKYVVGFGPRDLVGQAMSFEVADNKSASENVSGISKFMGKRAVGHGGYNSYEAGSDYELLGNIYVPPWIHNDGWYVAFGGKPGAGGDGDNGGLQDTNSGPPLLRGGDGGPPEELWGIKFSSGREGFARPKLSDSDNGYWSHQFSSTTVPVYYTSGYYTPSDYGGPLQPGVVAIRYPEYFEDLTESPVEPIIRDGHKIYIFEESGRVVI